MLDEELEAQAILPNRTFDGFLDKLILNSYKGVTETKPAGLQPSFEVYLGTKVEGQYDSAVRPLPPTEDDKQIETMQALGVATADAFNDGRVVVCAFLATPGARETAKEGETEEVLLLCGMSLDGRVNQAIYNVKRDEKGNMCDLDLTMFMPTRKQVSDKSYIVSPLMSAFYSGYMMRYNELLKEGRRDGDLILPN